MTPDDMERRLYDALNAVERIGMIQEDLRLAVVLFDAVNRSRALLLDYQERGRALEELMDHAEQCMARLDYHDACVLGSEPIDTARATLKGKSHD